MSETAGSPQHELCVETPVPIPDVTTVLAALADPVRMAIVRSLAQSERARCCGSMELPVTKSTLSHHVKVLRDAGIIEQRCEGTRKLTTLRRDDLEAVYPGLLESVLRAVSTPREEVPAAR